MWTVCVRAASWDSRDKNTLLGNSLVSEAFGLETNALILGSCSNSIHVDGKLICLLSKDFLLQDVTCLWDLEKHRFITDSTFHEVLSIIDPAAEQPTRNRPHLPASHLY